MTKAFLKSSKDFLEASYRASELLVSNGKLVSATTPSVVCLSFSVELGLKGLYILNHKKNKKGHDLDSLYQALDIETQNEIENRITLPQYPRYEDCDTKQLKYFLESHAKSFEDWRYSCELSKDLTADISFLRNLAETIHKITEEKIDRVGY